MADTALTIIERAVKHLGALESGASLTDDEAQDGLTSLNAMLESWAVEGLPLFGETLTTHTLTSGIPNYTIGSGATIDAARPTGLSAIRGAWIRDSNNIDRRIENLISFTRYQNKVLKNTTSPYAYYLALVVGAVTSEIFLYPTPSAANSLRLQYDALISFATLNTTFALPPGYRRAIEFNLALELAPMFELQASGDLYRLARDAKRSLEAINAAGRVALRTTDVPRQHTGQRYDVYSDGDGNW